MIKLYYIFKIYLRLLIYIKVILSVGIHCITCQKEKLQALTDALEIKKVCDQQARNEYSSGAVFHFYIQTISDIIILIK